jgi:hypothetical protein
MIKNFESFINENKLDYTKISELIEDAFTPMCDNNGLDFRLMEGYFINTIGSDVANQWITHQLLDDIKFIFREQGEKLISKRAIQITFLKSEAWLNHHVGEISDDQRIDQLNKDFQDGVKTFNKMNVTNFKLTRLPDEIKKTFWQIVFYVIED